MGGLGHDHIKNKDVDFKNIGKVDNDTLYYRLLEFISQGLYYR